MGLLQQRNNQYYKNIKSFTSDGTTANYTIADTSDVFHQHFVNLYNNEQVNPYVRLYVDGVNHAQIVDPNPGSIAPIVMWSLLLDANQNNVDTWQIEFAADYIPESGAIIEVRVDNRLWRNPANNVTELTTNDYQVTSLENIIGNFMIAYTGEDKIISKVSRTDVQFHAMRALQELSFDTLKSCKSQEIEIPPSLTMILPHDYVNYVKLSWKDDGGIKRVLYPTSKTSNPFAIQQSQDPEGEYYFDSGVRNNKDLNINNKSDTWNAFSSGEGSAGTSSAHLHGSTSHIHYDEHSRGLDGDRFNTRYGLEPEHTQINGSYFIDCARGMIHFSSTIAGKTVILDYISDSLGTDGEMVVHKFAEEAMYKSLVYAILSTRSNIQEYVIQRYKKERFAAVRKAKLRLSNIKLEEITQILRGKSKFIKH